MNSDRHVLLLMVAPTPVPTTVRTEGGLITAETTWGPEFERKVTSDVTVSPTGTLNILPGTVLKFDGTRLQVDGTLNAQGTPGNLISFSTDTNWQGITITNSKTNSSIVYAVIEKVAGTALDLDGGTVRLSNSVVRNSIQGIWARTNQANMFVNEIYSNDTGIIIGGRNSVNIRLSTIRDNNIGVFVVGPDGIVTMKYNNIRNNDEFDVVVVGSGTRNVASSGTWWGTVDKAKIEEKLKHSVDDGSLSTVEFEPIASGPVLGAP